MTLCGSLHMHIAKKTGHYFLNHYFLHVRHIFGNTHDSIYCGSSSGVDTISYILVSGYGSGGDIGFVAFSWNGGSSWRKNHLIILHIPGLENCREKHKQH